MNKINPIVKEGDKIICLHMEDQYSPVPAGTKGIVTRVTSDPFEENEKIIEVQWENGSSLSLVSGEDMWMKLDDLKNQKQSVNESKKMKVSTCSHFTKGKKFCERISDLLKSNKEVKNSARDFFNALKLNIDLNATGQKIVLKPGVPQFDERYRDLQYFYEKLKKSGQCKKMTEVIKQDLENVREKGLVMIVDNEEKYSLFNRLNTHYTNQSIILTQSILNTTEKYKSIDIDNWSGNVLKNNLLGYLEQDDENFTQVNNAINELLSDEDISEKLRSNFIYSKTRGDEVEKQAADLFRKKGYTVDEFGSDFGFVDYFGVDMLVEKDGVIHPVQVSSTRKSYPKFFSLNGPDCRCWSVYPYKGQFRVETPLE